MIEWQEWNSGRRRGKEVWMRCSVLGNSLPTVLKLRVDLSRPMTSTGQIKAEIIWATSLLVLETVLQQRRTSHQCSLISPLMVLREKASREETYTKSQSHESCQTTFQAVSFRCKIPIACNRLKCTTLHPNPFLLNTTCRKTMGRTETSWRDSSKNTIRCSRKWVRCQLMLNATLLGTVPAHYNRHISQQGIITISHNFSGFTKNSTSGNLIAHDFVDVRT